MTIHVTPIPKLTDFATNAIALGTAAAAGSAETVIRSDSTVIGFDTTVPGDIAASTPAATGEINFASRRDHTHGTVDVLLQAKTGTYSGDAASSQTISGLSILPVFLTISKRNTAAAAEENFDMTNSAIMDNHASGYTYTFGVDTGDFYSGKLTALNTDGFVVSNTVTTGGSLNGSGNSYDYLAIGY